MDHCTRHSREQHIAVLRMHRSSARTQEPSGGQTQAVPALASRSVWVRAAQKSRHSRFAPPGFIPMPEREHLSRTGSLPQATSIEDMLPIILTAVPAPKTSGLSWRPVTEDFLASAFAIESASYPEDEMASEEKLLMRIREAPEFFSGAFSAEGALCGFICGTLTTSNELTDESMSLHEPDGTTLCIHSVVVTESMRRQGIALFMLRSYMKQVTELQRVSRVLLICKEHLVRQRAHTPYEHENHHPLRTLGSHELLR